MAQWAVNVVDYRDPDGIMTQFRYDPNPFDGWDVDDTVPTTYRTVWGMEYPELTLEESLAFHDRRVRDTAEDDDTMQEVQSGPMTAIVDDVDQWRIPQGSLFLELRSTRSPQELLMAPTSIAEDESTGLSVTENGYGKRTKVGEYRLQHRGGSGIINTLRLALTMGT